MTATTMRWALAAQRHHHHHAARSSITIRHPVGNAVVPSRLMSSNAPKEEGDIGNNGNNAEELDPSVLANIYNHRRAHYNRAVSHLRKQYHAEYTERRERELRRKAAEEAKIRRETLERRRLKAMRSAENARRAMEKRERRRLEWEEELALTQRERDAKNELYRKARQRIVDELEAECHLWLTTPEEVERALGNPRASQALWSRPGGIIGAPSGPFTGFGDFGDFWRYECHAWDYRPTYKSPREVMLEELEHMAYLKTNGDPRYWTRERVRAEEMKEQRARLRAVVREEGRRSLLNKQREMMRDVYGGGEDDKSKKEHQMGNRLPPTAMPVPELDYLADYEAQEREGVEILRRDPRRFFIFEGDLPSYAAGGMGDAPPGGGNDEAVAASLGRPVAVRNPFFGDKPTAFPIRMGRDMPDDTRTEKEKKRDERQERMRAAAEEAALAASKGASYEVAMAAEEDLEDGSEDVDYDKAEEDAEKELWADQEEQWGDVDRRVFDMTPPFARLTPDDVNWIVGQLNAKIKKMGENLDFEEQVRRKETEKMIGGASKPIESVEEVDRYVMEGLGYDMDAIEALVKELTPEQSAALEDIDFVGRGGSITAEEMTDELKAVPGLKEEQIGALVEMEMKLLSDEKLKNITR